MGTSSHSSRVGVSWPLVRFVSEMEMCNLQQWLLIPCRTP